MAARAEMADLIGRLRALIGDAAGAGQVFADEELQEYLDARRCEHRYRPLAPVETIGTDGSSAALEWAALGGRLVRDGRWTGGPLGDWEADGTLYGAGYESLEPSSSDWRRGRWTFEAAQAGPVRIIGKTYDLMGSAADALEAWAARVARNYDVSMADQSMKRTQAFGGLLEMAERYRRRQAATSVKIGRSGAC